MVGGGELRALRDNALEAAKSSINVTIHQMTVILFALILLYPKSQKGYYTPENC